MRIHLKERRFETAWRSSRLFSTWAVSHLNTGPGNSHSYDLDTLDFPDERGNRRHFTLSSSPTEKGITMFTTRMRGSGFKETLRNAPLGYEVSIGVPAGLFVIPEDNTRSHVFIAGGIGVTPYRSILRHAVDTKTPMNALMLYFNHSSADIVFRQELEDIARQVTTFSLVHVLSEPEPGWAGERGKLNEVLLRKWVPNLDQRLFWISGPPSMVMAYKALIKQTGVPDESIRTDHFTGY